MAKYTEAYNDITNRNIDIIHCRRHRMRCLEQMG